MSNDLASTNVGRTYSLAGVSITIFIFTLSFLYPRYADGEMNALLFEAALTVMGVTTFSFVIASMLYYGASLAGRVDAASRLGFLRWGDRLWFLGYSLLFLSPSIILAAAGLDIVAGVWFVLWLGYLAFASRFYPRTAARGHEDNPPQSAAE
jgi:hypothetical protein